MAGGRGTNSNFIVFWELRCQNRRGKSLVYQNDDQQRKFAAKPDLFHTRIANYYNYYLSSFFMQSLYLRKMPRSNSKSICRG